MHPSIHRRRSRRWSLRPLVRETSSPPIARASVTANRTNERIERTYRTNRIHDRPVPRFEIRVSSVERRYSSVERRDPHPPHRAPPPRAHRAHRAHPPTHPRAPTRVEIRDASSSSFKIIIMHTHTPRRIAHTARAPTHPSRSPHPPSGHHHPRSRAP